MTSYTGLPRKLPDGCWPVKESLVGTREENTKKKRGCFIEKVWEIMIHAQKVATMEWADKDERREFSKGSYKGGGRAEGSTYPAAEMKRCWGG